MSVVSSVARKGLYMFHYQLQRSIHSRLRYHLNYPRLPIGNPETKLKVRTILQYQHDHLEASARKLIVEGNFLNSVG
jgi:hypothetical protein